MNWSVMIIGAVLINLCAYFLMILDKWNAKKGLRRVSENTLFIVAVCFGATGIYLGMMAPLKHKSSKLKFRIGIPVCLLLNIFLFYRMENLFFSISI